jgi:hypothetical protein
MGKRKIITNASHFEEHQSRKYYKEVEKVRAGFQPRINFCKDKEGNLITSKDKIMDRWVEHFSELLNKGTLVEEEGEENESIEIRNHTPTNTHGSKGSDNDFKEEQGTRGWQYYSRNDKVCRRGNGRSNIPVD